MQSLDELATFLSRTSVKCYNNPYEEFDWPESINRDSWTFSPELISIYGTSFYDLLTEEQKKRLAFWECINFFSLNIHGEKSLLQGLTQQLYSNWPGEISNYLHHFVDEENKHMTIFGNYCLRYGQKIYPSKLLAVPRNFQEGEEDFLFFVRVIIFEHMVDYYNIHMAKDETLHPFIRQIHRYHHSDEGRHLAFGRLITKQIFEKYSKNWSEETLANIRGYLNAYIQANWREYYNPGIYRDAGLTGDAYEIYETAWHSEHAKLRRKNVSKICVNFLVDNNILLEEPQL